MKFSYTARNESGTLEHGEMDSPSEHNLAQDLRNKGLLLTKAEVIGAASKKPFGQFKMPFGGKVKALDKVFFAQNLQVMVKAGLPLAVSIKTLAQQTQNKTFRTILEDIYLIVSKGTALSDALGKYPKVFSELFVNMVRAGEKSGKLEDVMAQLATQMRKNHQLVSKVRGALTYPVIVILAMLGIAAAMIVFVIPRITTIFQEVNATLPLPTRILIGISDFVTSNGILVGGGLILLVFGFIQFIHSKGGKKIWDGFLLKLPVISPIIQKINLAKFARTFSSLLKTDIPIVQAFQITAATLGNSLYQSTINEAAERVKKGVTVASILGESPKLFSPLVIQMIAVGEETGTIDTILSELANFYEDDVDRTMSNLATILEPVLILILGLGVAGLAISIILPIYSLTQSV